MSPSVIDFNDKQAVNRMHVGNSMICWYPSGTFTIKDLKTGRYTIHYHTGDVVYFQSEGPLSLSHRPGNGDVFHVVDVWSHDQSRLNK